MLLSSDGAAAQARWPDGLYAELHTNKGLIVTRLEPDMAPLAVTSFVGLAEGTIENAAFDAGRPFYDGTVWHRVVPGHVIQAGMARSERSTGPGYRYPNEIHEKLSHDHAGALGVANGGPHTNASQFYITLGDRSYLDHTYIVFGDVVSGMDIVMSVVQGDVVDSVRIVRVGTRAETFHPTTQSFRESVRAAEQRVAEHAEKQRAAEQEWISRNWPRASGPAGGVLTERLRAGTGARPGGGPVRVRYRGSTIRYMADLLGHEGPPLVVRPFGSGDDGVPGAFDPPRTFTFEPGNTTINPGIDSVIVRMMPGERRAAIVPAALGYGRSGLFTRETPGQPRFVIPPNTLLFYEIEVLANEGDRTSISHRSRTTRGRARTAPAFPSASHDRRRDRP
jgi:peptidylprolyl isomerase